MSVNVLTLRLIRVCILYSLFASLCLHLPAEQFHEVLEAVLSEEVEGALGGAQVDQQEHEQHHGQQRDQHVPAGCQDVVPLGLVRALLGHLQVALSLLVPGLDGVDESHESQAAEVYVQGVAQRPD